MSTKSKSQPHTRANPEDAQTPGTDVAKLSTGAGQEPRVRLKALLTPEFLAWRKNAFAMAEEPGTASWFREALLWLFLMGSVSLSQGVQWFFSSWRSKLMGGPTESSCQPKKTHGAPIETFLLHGIMSLKKRNLRWMKPFLR